MLSDKDRVRFEACKRSVQFGKDYDADIPDPSQLRTDFHALESHTNNTEASAGKKAAGIGESGQQFDLKAISREDVVEIMSAPADAARAAEPAHPGTQARFHFDRNLNDVDLIAAANSFLACDAAEEALLITYMAPATWKDDLTTAVTAFNSSFMTAASASDAKVAATAEAKQHLNAAMQTKRTIHHMVKIVFKNNPAALAAWHAASTVEKV